MRAALPVVLSSADRTTYRELFALGRSQPWQPATELIAQVRDPVLVGHALAVRYLDPNAGASAEDLAGWLAEYADLPQASQISARLGEVSYALADDTSSGLWSLLKPTPQPSRVMPERSDLDYAAQGEAQGWKRQISAAIKGEDLSTAAMLLDSSEAQRLLSEEEIDQYRARLGLAYLRAGMDQEAFAQASAAATRSGVLLPDADWIAGLAAWRLTDYAAAAQHFASMGSRSDLTSWPSSGAKFWAARSYLYAGQPQSVSLWLNRAAEHGHTFYGLLARRILGLPMPHQWQMSERDRAAVQVFAASPAGRRVLALLEIDETELAAREIRAIVTNGDVTQVHGAMIAAEAAQMAHLAYAIQRILWKYDIEYPPAAYPLPDWQPADGFIFDPALVFAMIRQESAFNPRAVSSAGARGVMQLMPATARFVAQKTGLDGADSHSLTIPAYNMRLGQRYIEMLLSTYSVGADLFRLAAAWNGGPGNLSKWSRQAVYYDDPLLFIEVLPAAETRDFIERVLANLWIYRHRLGQPSPSLDALAAGEWPGFDGHANGSVEFVLNGGSR